jgi:hypothetical protein
MIGDNEIEDISVPKIFGFHIFLVKEKEDLKKIE